MSRMSTFVRTVASLALLLIGSAAAQTPTPAARLQSFALKDPKGPCPYVPIDLEKPGVAMQPLKTPPALRSVGGVLQTDLTVKYTDPAKTKLADCGVKLRSFNGELVGPTIRLKPGDTLKLNLINALPKETAAEVARQYEDEATQAHLVTIPHSFNTTNMHYHGLHVSPSSHIVRAPGRKDELIASDDVLIAVMPGQTQKYEVAIPKNHPAGTFWYHPHAHGSTSIQVGSGMAGALIIDDDPATLPASLRDASDEQHEKILEFESILYNQDGEVTTIASFFPSPGIPTVKNCAAFGGPLPDQTSVGTWQCSNRRTTVNGQIVPIIHMRPGEVSRWRMIDTSFRESIELQLDDHTLHEIALDGIYTGKIDDWNEDTQPLDLEPGYRSDVLVKARPCNLQQHAASEASLLSHSDVRALLMAPNARAVAPTTCRYGLWNRAVSTNQSLRGSQQREALLAILEVDGDPENMTLPTAAEMAKMNPFPNVNLPAQLGQQGGPIGVQEVVFKLGADLRNPGGTPNCASNPGGCPTNYFQVNYMAYDPSHERKLLLGATEMWNITTVGDPANVPSGIPPLPHVFHIHVNPFQVSRSDPNGNPELVWKDTLLIPPAANVNVYTQYLDFTGAFVMHCHILDHEDLGMMEVENVVKDLATPMPDAMMMLEHDQMKH